MDIKTLHHGSALLRTLNFFSQLLVSIETLVGLEQHHKEQLKEQIRIKQAVVQSQFDALGMPDEGMPPMKAVDPPAAAAGAAQEVAQPAVEEKTAQVVAGDDGG